MPGKKGNIDQLLEVVIKEFVQSAIPVSSRCIVEKYGMNYSSATIRNMLARLEDMGFLTHPHTSAGRVPTNSGYRYYIDTLLKRPILEKKHQDFIDVEIQSAPADLEYILNMTSRLLGKLSEEIGIALAPVILNGFVETVDVIELSSARFLLILEIEGGMVKTLMVETSQELSPKRIPVIRSFMKKQLMGKTLAEISSLLGNTYESIHSEDYHLVRELFHAIENNTAPKYYSSDPFAVLSETNAHNSTLHHLLATENWLQKLQGKTESRMENGRTMIFGDEIDFIEGDDCAAVLQKYTVGRLNGVLAVVGPARMAYDQIIPLVGFFSEKITMKIHKRKELR